MQGLPWRSTDARLHQWTAARPPSFLTVHRLWRERKLDRLPARIGHCEAAGCQGRGADECPRRRSPP
jgi:hypothetical protein